jgi:hypothetical protein
MPELQSVNAEAAASTDSNILAEFWEEIEYWVDVCHVIYGAHRKLQRFSMDLCVSCQ